jgi:ankyrin repeat protein
VEGKNNSKLDYILLGLNDLVSLLLDAGAEVNKQDKYLFTPIADAAFGGRLECVKLLAEKGKADLNIPNRDGMTPLHWVTHSTPLSNCQAVENRKYDCVDYLIKKGGDTNALSQNGQSIFDLCATLKIKQKKKMEEVIKNAQLEYSRILTL